MKHNSSRQYGSKSKNQTDPAVPAAQMPTDASGGSTTVPSSEDLLKIARLATLGELCASFARDTFDPLMLIRGKLAFLKERLPEDDPLRTEYAVLDDASKRIEDTARGITDFSRKHVMQREPCDVAEIIGRVTKFLHPFLRDKYIDLTIRVVDGLPLVRVDKRLVAQALVNLLQNAAEAMTAADTRVLGITARLEGQNVRIAISDTGPGIPSEDLPFIFDPFFTTKGERGSGLGLFMTKGVIEQNGGAILLQTSARGTTFVISLPAEEDQM